MGRFRIKIRMSRKQKVLLEVGVFILGVILLLGALNTITATYKTPILTTEDLWKHANTTIIHFEFRNSTDTSKLKSVKYMISDVATFYDGYLYISIPYPDGYEVLRAISISNFTVRDGQALTVGYMIEHGVNKLTIYIEPINSTPVSFGSAAVYPLRFGVDTSGDDDVWLPSPDNIILFEIVPDSAEQTSSDDIKWGALFPDNGTVDREISIDLGSIAIKAAGYNDAVVGLHRVVGDVKNLEGFKLKLEIYAVSEKPVLKALSEPLYAMVAGLWSALLGLWRRVQSVVASAFGGFSLSAIFTGLIGDPVVALIVSIFIITIFFLIMRPRR
mgnify:CR=1 FL=1